jgi:hypothetical protein
MILREAAHIGCQLHRRDPFGVRTHLIEDDKNVDGRLVARLAARDRPEQPHLAQPSRTPCGKTGASV